LIRYILPIALTCVLASSHLYAAAKDYAWLRNIASHPNISVAKGVIQTQQWRIKEMQAERGFDIDVSTTGDVPIVSDLQDDFTRASDNDPYLDIVVSGSYILYDFEQAQQKINAEKSSYEVRKLEYLTAIEEELHRLLGLVTDNQKVLEQLAALKMAQPQLLKIQQQLETRYEAGLGTLTEVRQIHVQLLDLHSQITLLENRLQSLQLTAEEQYELSSEELVVIWHDIKHVLTVHRDLDYGGRSAQLSELKIQSLMHHQASVRAEAMPVLQGELNATLYDVTRSFDNYQLSGQLRLKMPVFDSGYRDARIGSLQHAMTTELDMKRQLQRQKQFQLNEIARQDADLRARLSIIEDKLNNQVLQLNALQQALGKTGNDINGVGNYMNQIATSRTELAGLKADANLNALQKLLVTEQLLASLDIELTDLL